MLKVVAALVKKDNKYLIARRIYGDPESQGKWEFPGGKIEANETEEHAVERELKEEFDIVVKAKRYITNSIYAYTARTIDLRLYECDYISGDFKLNIHSEYKWVNIEELLDYDLADADVILSKYLIKKYIEDSRE